MPHSQESPWFFAVSKGETGWVFSRRDFITLAGAATAGAALACGRSRDDETPEVDVLGTNTAATVVASFNQPAAAATVEAPMGDELAQRLEACETIRAHNTSIWWMEASADSRLMVTSPSDGVEKLWHLPGGALVFSVYEGQLLYFIPNQNFLLLDLGDGNVDLYNTDGPSLVTSFSGEMVGGKSDLYSPEGSLFALLDGFTVTVYELPSADVFAVVSVSDTPEALSLSPDHSLLAVGYSTGEISLYSLSDGEEQKTISAHPATIKNLVIGAGGSRLVSFDNVNPTLKFWSLPDGELVSEAVEGDGAIWFGDLLANGEMLLTWHDDNLRRLWSLEDGGLVQTFAEGDEQYYAPDGSTLITTSEEMPFSVFSLPDMQEIITIEKPVGVPTWPVSVSPDETMFAFVRDDITVEIHAIADGALLATLSEHAATVDYVFFTTDNAMVITGQTDGAVNIYTIGGEFVSCLVDMSEMPEEVEVNQYTTTTETGETITYTLPCGSPIPAGAVCTCNCVGGGGGSYGCSCVGYVSCSCVGDVCSCVSYISGGGSHYWYPN